MAGFLRVELGAEIRRWKSVHHNVADFCSKIMGWEHQGLVLECSPLHGLLAREVMADRKCYHHGLTPEKGLFHIIIVDLARQHDKIDGSRAKPGMQYAPVALDGLDLCLRISGIPVDNRSAQVAGRHCAIVANRNHATMALAG